MIKFGKSQEILYITYCSKNWRICNGLNFFGSNNKLLFQWYTKETSLMVSEIHTFLILHIA